MRKTGKTVLITGADRGVGFALCAEFVKNGWTVLAGRFMEEWKELDELKERYPDQLVLLPLDVSDTESVQRAAKRAAEQFDTLDMLINCAGIASREDSREKVMAVFQVNILGALRMTEAVLPMMKNGQKRICFVSSEAGSISVAHRTDGYAYCMSKTGLNMTVRLMFNQLAREGYTFRLYHPGWVRSYMMGQKSTMGNFEPEETAAVAYRQFTGDREYEDVLMMTDVSDECWPF